MFLTRYNTETKDFFETYRVILMRNPTSVMLIMALSSTLIGLGFLASKTNSPDILRVMLEIASVQYWGIAFLSCGIFNILSIGVRFPKTLDISVGVISLFLWVMVNLSSVQTPVFDTFQLLLLVTVLMDTWILVHKMLPHRQKFRRRVDAF